MMVCLHLKIIFFHRVVRQTFHSTFRQQLERSQIWPVLTVLICLLFVLWSILLDVIPPSAVGCMFVLTLYSLLAAIIPSYTAKFVCTYGNWLLNFSRLKKFPFEFVSCLIKRMSFASHSLLHTTFYTLMTIL